MSQNIENIIKGCRKNKRQSQSELYHAFYSYGMSIAVRYATDHDEAKGIVNDGFMKVFNNVAKFDASREFKPWFRKIIVNTALSHMKKKHDPIFLHSQLTEEVYATTREEVFSKIGFQELLNIVKTLSTAYRTVFNMYVIDGYNHKEISNVLGISVGTSKSNLSKARAILQSKVSQYLEVERA